ncbi:acyl-CoA dehydratase activase [Maribellus sediminis]|uniref:acyl-CoA dehydratase activase n=1 Tax=Maribellus sediminis TaxID=2696285 RepID=UPI0014302385|nr:acyl-CoA dehydratase activase [Maribellus sediminis]
MKYLGSDIGSISVNTVLVNENKEIIEEFYDYSRGRPFNTLKNRLSEILEKHDDISGTIALTGTGSKVASELLNGIAVNEIVAQSKAVMELYPEVRTVIEMGGEDSKLIFLEKNDVKEGMKLSDFTMNSLCAAGTGSFLDQQAKRIGVSIEKEFGEMALQSEKPPRIAGRCSVFAKSDMIHLQQVATPVHDIVAGLCFAVARNFKSTLGKGKPLVKPIIFQGGVAANQGMIRAFTETYNLQPGELIIPKHFASMGAIGAVLFALETNSFSQGKISLRKLTHYLEVGSNGSETLLKLADRKHELIKDTFSLNGEKNIDAYLGIDVGSLSTNVVIIDKNNNVLSRRYLPTASRPLEAIKRGLAEVGEEIGSKVVIRAVGTTGSGRYLTGDFVGADSIQNEITAQATAAIQIDPEVDTIFEIGGQDSKYISISNGVIVDFEMNKVCAAGTGSFLEEQADKLGINIINEFGEKGLSAEHPAKLGERCTVFMESDLNSHQQNGTQKDNLIAGLAYSIVHNYLNRVVRDKPVGNKIFFQGGVTNNKAVLAAFEEVTGKAIHVPPHFDITGAIGAAILARQSINGDASRFKGFEISKTNYETDNFVCKSCANHCEIKRVKIEGETKPLFYGGICDKYEIDERKKAGADLPNYFEEREDLLTEGFQNKEETDKISIGIPRALMNYYQLFPFWKTFFSELNFNLIVSDESDKKIITDALETMVSETCLPVEMVHGHVLNLIEKKVDYVFLPFVVNVQGDQDNPTNNCNCPWVQSHPYLVKAAFTDEKIREKLLIPSLHFRYFERALKKELQQFFSKKFDLPKARIIKAIDKANEKQKLFEKNVKLKGRDVLSKLDENTWNFIIIGRPYNTGDPLLNLRLVKKLQNMNVRAIPMDFLPLEEENIFEDYPGMYWPNGQKILKASRIIARTKNLFAIYLSNFRCGPDSFLLHFVKNEMKGKPFMHLEVDEHSADAGMITRIEAFVDSLKGWKINNEAKPVEEQSELKDTSKKVSFNERTIYFPYARDAVHFISAACRSCDIPSEVLPMADKEDLELGRKYTDGQECFPFICTLGSFLKKLKQPGLDPAKSSFFMPDHNGPCRFGEYNKLHRQVFDKLGYTEAKIVHPSNEDAYASIAPGQSTRWRKNTWQGIVAGDLLRKMQEQTRPYEIEKGETNKVYEKYLQKAIASVENNCKGLSKTLEEAARAFKAIPVNNPGSKPLVAIVGEIFMRDNPYCSNFLVDRLEKLGAETVMAPFGEWINYSTIRFVRDSRWKGNMKNLIKAKIQLFFQKTLEKKLTDSLGGIFNLAREVEVEEMLENCGEFIHKDYDGDPPLAIGSAVLLAGKSISGVVNILPFTCMPGTINCTVSQNLRQKYHGLPWENFAYDGNDNIGVDTRFEAFMFQVKEFHERQKQLKQN